MLSGTPTDNNGAVEVPYDSYCGEVTVPAIADIMAMDICSDATACDMEANEAANAMIADALGTDVLGTDGYLDYLTGVTTSGINNPFVTGGTYPLGSITTPATLLDGETCDNNPKQQHAHVQLRRRRVLHDRRGCHDEGPRERHGHHLHDGVERLGCIRSGSHVRHVDELGRVVRDTRSRELQVRLRLGRSRRTWDYAILLDGTITGCRRNGLRRHGSSP